MKTTTKKRVNTYMIVAVLATFLLFLAGLIANAQNDTIYDEGSTTNYTVFDSTGTALLHYTVVEYEPPYSQEYIDLFPKGKRAPWGWRIYEKWQMQQIYRIDTYSVLWYFKKVWLQGLIPFKGDTSKLVFKGWQQNTDVAITDTTFNSMYSPVYEYYDTLYTMPTLEGFETWKELGRPKVE